MSAASSSSPVADTAISNGDGDVNVQLSSAYHTSSSMASPPRSPASGRSATPTGATSPPAAAYAPPAGAPPTTTNASLPPPPSTDPKVAELQVMFPTVEQSVIEMILESVGGSQDRAIETLLSMTDPEFKPDERLVRTEAESQYDLDAQFARSLAMQDEQDSQARQGAGVGAGQLPYQPRVRRNRPEQGNGQYVPAQGEQAYAQRGYGQSSYGQQDRQNGQNPPGMLAVEDKLNQFAEVGKQTFNSFFNKAKAKYAEFQTQNAAANSGERDRETQWGQSGNEPWRQPSPSGPMPGGGRGGEQNRRGIWSPDDASSFSSQSSDPGPTPISPHTASNPPLRQTTARWNPSDAYEDPSPPVRTASGNRIEVGGRRSPGVGSPDKGTAPIGKIDPAKLGILPKKRVDLMSTSPPATTPANKNVRVEDDDDDDPNPSLPSAHKSLVEQIPKTPPANKESQYSLGDSDDDLEYTKNPFDEK